MNKQFCTDAHSTHTLNSHAPHTERGTLTVTLSNNAHIKHAHVKQVFCVGLNAYTCIYKHPDRVTPPPFSLFLSLSIIIAWLHLTVTK